MKAEARTGIEEFYLFETFRCSGENGPNYLERHLARLSASAKTLGFICEIDRIQQDVLQHAKALTGSQACRMRVALKRTGMWTITSAPLPPLSTPVRILLAGEWGFAPQNSSDPLLLHKTSKRDTYDCAWKLAEAQGGFDMLFTNELGKVTEGGRSNIFVKLDGHWWTPPLTAGVLPGIMRGVLLEDILFGASEKSLVLDEVLKADELLLCNSLRGVLKANLLRPSS